MLNRVTFAKPGVQKAMDEYIVWDVEFGSRIPYRDAEIHPNTVDNDGVEAVDI